MQKDAQQEIHMGSVLLYMGKILKQVFCQKMLLSKGIMSFDHRGSILHIYSSQLLQKLTLINTVHEECPVASPSNFSS